MGRFRDLRLVWKLLLPLVSGALVVGLLGSFLVVRTLSSRAQTSLDEDLFRRSVVAEARVRDQAGYLVESVRFGANIQGVAKAVRARDVGTVRNLVAAVLATRPQLDLLVVTDSAGRALVQAQRVQGRLVVSGGRDWSRAGLVAAARRGDVSPIDKHVGLQRLGRATFLGVAAPVRLGRTVGVIVAAVDVASVAARAAADIGGPVAFFGEHALLGASGVVLPAPVEPSDPRHSLRQLATVAGRRVAVSYSAIVLNDQVLGTLAVSAPSDLALASVRTTRNRLLLLLAFALAGLMAFGALINHLVLRQVRPLVTLNRALGRGDLTARTPVLGNDELGELATGLNLMAEQLEAAHAEAEHRVAARTEELERLYRQLSQLSMERSQTFAALSHEFRNDLLVISGYAQLMVDPSLDLADPDWPGEFGRNIQDSARTALERVTEALEVARAEHRTMDLALEDGVWLGLLLEDVHGMVVALARRADLDVEWQVPSDLPSVTADVRRLREVVMNLLSNAVKYTHPGGTVTVTAGTYDGHVELSVADTGIGIPPEALAHVFEPFYRVLGSKPERGEASSGLGLAHVKRVVEAHGGTVGVVSHLGEGSTFTIRLPLAPAPKPSRRRRQLTPSP
jgi:signal transduction histidine kinase